MLHVPFYLCLGSLQLLHMPTCVCMLSTLGMTSVPLVVVFLIVRRGTLMVGMVLVPVVHKSSGNYCPVIVIILF